MNLGCLLGNRKISVRRMLSYFVDRFSTPGLMERTFQAIVVVQISQPAIDSVPERVVGNDRLVAGKNLFQDRIAATDEHLKIGHWHGKSGNDEHCNQYSFTH